MNHRDVIETVSNSLRSDTGICALFLSGSYANGLADEYSNIDFVLVAHDGATDEIAEACRSAIGQIGEIVLWWDRTTRPSLVNAIVEGWTRIDMLILKPGQLALQSQSDLTPLFDHDNLFSDLPVSTKKQGPDPARLRYQFEEFIRILGLLHLAVGREEYINGVLGVFHLRNLLVDLLIEETGAPNRGGVLHLNRLITDEQKELLISLPPAVPNLDAMISAHIAYAQVYLPRARKLAGQWGVD